MKDEIDFRAIMNNFEEIDVIGEFDRCFINCATRKGEYFKAKTEEMMPSWIEIFLRTNPECGRIGLRGAISAPNLNWLLKNQKQSSLLTSWTKIETLSPGWKGEITSFFLGTDYGYRENSYKCGIIAVSTAGMFNGMIDKNSLVGHFKNIYKG